MRIRQLLHALRTHLPARFLSHALLGMALASLAGCGKQDKRGKAEASARRNLAFAGVVDGHTGGLISAEGPIRVTLVNPVADTAAAGKPLAKNPFEFKPSIPGTARWADRYTVEFQPAAKLERGRTYAAALRLDRLGLLDNPAAVPAKPETPGRFEFTFTAMRQSFEWELDGLEAADEKRLEWQRLRGLLRFADGEDGAAVERMLSATQDGRPLPVRWEHRSDRREHAFSLDSLRRGETASRARLRFDGGPVGVEGAREDSAAVPALGEFTVLAVEAGDGEGRHALVRLSDPVQKGQDLRGLIEVQDMDGLRFQPEGNTVKVYAAGEWNGARTVTVRAGLRNAQGKPLLNPGSFRVAFESIKPGARFTGKGVIHPGDSKLILPFEAANLEAVDVQVIRVFAGNLPQFLQVNGLDGQQDLRRVGRPVLRKTVDLDPAPSMRERWARYALDLSELARQDDRPGTLYRVTLSFRRSQSAFPCADSAAPAKAPARPPTEERALDAGWDGGPGYYHEYDDGDDGSGGYDGEAYRWEERDNPCKPAYYRYAEKPARNVLASNVGLLAKSGRPGSLLVAATDILTARPLPDAELEVLSYQHQILARARTDGDGFAEIALPARAFLLRAAKGKQMGYLKLDDGGAIQMGGFDVGGTQVQEGLKGYLFGERGVWRPGDSLHLTFILEDRAGRLPPGHPVTFELRNPRGQLVRSMTRTSRGGFYDFSTVTDPDAPTGDWLARVRAGPAEFEERLKVETVVPNRLKIRVGLSPEPLSAAAPVEGTLAVSWLSGAVARDLEAEVEMTLRGASQSFKGYEGHAFEDPARSFSPETQTLWQGRVDGEGKAAFSKRVEVSGQAPGPLKASFRAKVTEAGGAFSVDRWSQPFHPYPVYVGVKLPLDGRGWEALEVDSTHRVRLAALTPEGRKAGRRRVEIKVFKAGWNWWWDSGEGPANYLQNEHATRVLHDTVTLADGEGTWDFSIAYPQYGSYVLRACDLDVAPERSGSAPSGEGGGHCGGARFYMDWPYGYDRAGRGNQGGGPAILAFKTDKASYAVGETVRVTIPGTKGGRALVSIEKGPAVIRRQWLDLGGTETVHEFPAGPEMAPNAYVHVTMLQPHAGTVNDLPIRLYNVLPIAVEDPATRLKPLLQVEPGVFRPGRKAAVTVREAGGKAMEYVVAVVDEGLLDLTRFATPDPWARFHAREALGVKTWDLYDLVAGADGGRLERLLSIGGDEGAPVAPEGRKGNRFPPMVRFLGPFALAGGKTARHEFDVPEYVGAVRAMVVAGRDGAYGHAEQSVPVRNPLMVLGTLPRVLGPGESLALPVSVFALEKHVRDVEVEVQASGPLRIAGERRKTLSLAAPADELLSFALETPEAAGWAKLTIRARSGKETAVQVLEIEVRNPNAPVTDVVPALMQPGETWKHAFRPPGIAGTNKAVLELSRLPPVNLGKRLDFLLQYPHGCVEQTTSGAFPQLYLDALLDLSPRQKEKIEINVKSAVRRLQGFQTPSGGFGYWPGDPDPDDWASTYAGHFLLEAEKRGFGVPPGMLDAWKRYQRAAAQGWNSARYDRWRPLSQSYRLYTLALAGSPEIGAMNRLKEKSDLDPAARWQLGAAYFLAGQPEVAASLVKGPAKVTPYRELGGSFGSDLRDKAMMLEVLSLLGKRTEATPLLQEVAHDLSEETWYSTQTTAHALIAVSRYAGRLFDRNDRNDRNQKAAYALTVRGAAQEGEFAAPLRQLDLAVADGADHAIELRNRGQGPLYARLLVTGTPPPGRETEAANALALEVRYLTMDGRPLDVGRLGQGTEFLARVKVRHPGNRGPYEQLALTTLFPAGWEIRNTRLDAVADPAVAPTSAFAFQDFRDDRVNTYFDLRPGEEKVFNVFLSAAYLGRYHLPQSRVEAMYDATINARSAGREVEVAPR